MLPCIVPKSCGAGRIPRPGLHGTAKPISQPGSWQTGGCDRKGLSLGKQLHSTPATGQLPLRINPAVSAATVLRHQSAPSALRCCSPVPFPSEERQNASLHFFSLLLLFFLPHKEKLARSASFFPEPFPLSNAKSICRTGQPHAEMLTLFQYWFSCGCIEGWQQLKGHYGTLWHGSCLRGTGQLCSDHVKAEAALPNSRRKFTHRKSHSTSSLWVLCNYKRVCWPFGSALRICLTTSARHQVQAERQVSRLGLCTLLTCSLSSQMGPGPSSFGSGHKQSTVEFVPSTSHGVYGQCICNSTPSPSWGAREQSWSRLQAAKEERKAVAAGFPDPSEVCSTLLARDDSAVDEALKLYWK